MDPRREHWVAYIAELSALWAQEAAAANRACAERSCLLLFAEPGRDMQLYLVSGLEHGDLTDELANHMGLFLQKTNIIRDYLEDIVEEPAPRCSALIQMQLVVCTHMLCAKVCLEQDVLPAS